MNFEKFKKFVLKDKLPPYRIGQAHNLIYKKAVIDWRQMEILPTDLRNKLADNFKILSFNVDRVYSTKSKKVFKASLKLDDKSKIETVLMNSFADNWSVCVSTQAGCPVKCSFCATGRMGFKRNLTEEEITDQLLFWMYYIKSKNIAKRISGVVFMGMGEPFLNYSNVSRALKKVSNKDFFNIGQRHISVSTCGHSANIKKFAVDFPQVNLSVSLHSTTDEKRNKLVPMNRKYDVASITDALTTYLRITKRKVFIEYTLIPKVNDNFQDARELSAWVNTFKQSYLLHINLILCSNFGESKINPDPNRIKSFISILKANKVSVTLRKSMGATIYAACGQLGLLK